MPKQRRKKARAKTDRSKAQPKARPKAGVFLDRKSLNVAGAAGVEDGRFALTNVYLEPNGTTVATNGRMIFAVEGPRHDHGDFPSVGQKSRPAAVPAAGALLPAGLVKNLRKRVGKKQLPQEILNSALMTRCDDDLIEFAVTDLKTIQKEGARPVDGTFPPWKEMIGSKYREVFFHVYMHPRRLRDMLDVVCKVTRETDVGDNAAVELAFTCGEFSQMILRGEAGPGRGFVGVVAPVRVKGARKTSDWERETVSAEDPETNLKGARALLEAVASKLEESPDDAPPEASAMINKLCCMVGVVPETHEDEG